MPPAHLGSVGTADAATAVVGYNKHYLTDCCCIPEGWLTTAVAVADLQLWASYATTEYDPAVKLPLVVVALAAPELTCKPVNRQYC